MQRTQTTLRWAATFLFAAVFCCASAWAGENRCVTAKAPEALILPDGKSYDADTLQICVDRSYSPVAGLHKLYIDGKPVGMFLSKRIRSKDDGTFRTPTMEFTRNDDGAWVLESYAVPVDRQLIVYNLSDRAKNAASVPTEEPVVVAVSMD